MNKMNKLIFFLLLSFATCGIEANLNLATGHIHDWPQVRSYQAFTKVPGLMGNITSAIYYNKFVALLTKHKIFYSATWGLVELYKSANEGPVSMCFGPRYAAWATDKGSLWLARFNENGDATSEKRVKGVGAKQVVCGKQMIYILGTEGILHGDYVIGTFHTLVRGKYRKLAIGGYRQTSFVIDGDNQLWAWGDGFSGFTFIAENVSDVVATDNHVFYLSKDGYAYCGEVMPDQIEWSKAGPNIVEIMGDQGNYKPYGNEFALYRKADNSVYMLRKMNTRSMCNFLYQLNHTEGFTLADLFVLHNPHGHMAAPVASIPFHFNPSSRSLALYQLSLDPTKVVPIRDDSSVAAYFMLNALLNNPHNYDVKFLMNKNDDTQEAFYAHRFVLAASSRTMEQKLGTVWKNQKVIALNSNDSMSMLNYLHNVYLGHDIGFKARDFEKVTSFFEQKV